MDTPCFPINIIGNRDAFQRAEFAQRERFDLFFHHDFLSSLKPPPIKQKPCQASWPTNPGRIRVNHRTPFWPTIETPKVLKEAPLTLRLTPCAIQPQETTGLFSLIWSWGVAPDPERAPITGD